MEFRCRLGTAERRNRRRGLRRRQRGAAAARARGEGPLRPRRSSAQGALAARLPVRCRRGAASRTREFLVFNQELASCSRPACRWCSRSTSCASASPNPVFKAVLDDVYERVRAGIVAVGRVCSARRPVSRHLHRVAPRGREERRPRAGAAALRRVREGDRRGEAQDDLGAGLSRRSCSSLSLVVVGIIVLKVVPEFAAFYESFGARAAACHADHRAASRS